jgi:hypothetical protein
MLSDLSPAMLFAKQKFDALTLYLFSTVFLLTQSFSVGDHINVLLSNS